VIRRKKAFNKFRVLPARALVEQVWIKPTKKIKPSSNQN